MNYPISVRIVELENAPFRSAKAADAYARSHGITGRKRRTSNAINAMVEITVL